MELVESGKFQIATIHDVDGPWFYEQLIEDIDIVHFSRSDDHHRRNAAMQIQEGVELYRAFAFPKFGPRENSQAEIDGGRIQSIDCLI